MVVPEVADFTFNGAQLWLASFGGVVRRWQRTGKRPANHTPMNIGLRGNASDRPDTKLMLPTELLEQIHFGVPVHKRPPDPIAGTVG